ncbi:MAG: hypothetical protein JWO91_518 [Acidobacteriaceae bacterium]|nr:hypothetical protein [Acidobacteriaceae bacterium]
MSPLVLEAPPKPLPVRAEKGTPVPLSFREIGCGYRPGRTFGLSVILHQLALLLIVFFSSRYALVRSVETVPFRVDVLPVDNVLYLPTLGGGSEGAGKRGGGSGNAEEISSGVRARSRRGFAYPGPQPMVSDPPRATLGIQTILQPALKNLPLVRRYMPLPSIAQPPAVAAAEPPKPVIKVQSGRLALRPAADKTIQAPKVKLPAAAASKVPALATWDPVMPQPLPAKPEVPNPPEISDLRIDRKAKQGLLVLNAVPPPPDVPTKIPLVEARSLFAVAPGEATVIADPAAGAKGGGLPSMATGSGTPADVTSGDALAEAAAGAGSSKSLGSSGSGNSGRYGSGKGSGLNPAGEAAGTGRGTAAGAGTGSGAETTLGSGKGAGSAPGGGGFPGITIHGGGYGNGAAGSLHASVTPHRQTSYGMTITSTASSGGGLPDFGIFQNEKVYTVYLDMRANDEDPAPSWTLQYAVLQPLADSANSGGASSRIQGTPTPPYAMLKEIPELTRELASKCAHQLIIASAIMNVSGKLEQVSVRHTPDSQLIAPLTEALNNWSFQPAQIDGKPVALKIVLGIRLAPPAR